MSRKRKLGDEIKRSRNTIIKDVIEKNFEYFEQRIEGRLNRGHSFSGNQIDEAFFDIIIEDENDDGYPLELVKTEIATNGKIGFDQVCSDALLRLLADLLLNCVEKEKSVSLKKVLDWLQFKLAPLTAVKQLLLHWDWVRPVGSNDYAPRWTGLTGDSPAMIRACEKDDFGMVSSLMNFKFSLNDKIDDTFRIDDKEFKPCEHDEKEKWKNRQRLRNFFAFPLTRRKFLYEENDILHHYRSFYAVSKPSYMIAMAKKENKNKKFERYGLTPYDPISEAFHNLHVARVQSFRNVEYRNKFKIVKRESKKFIVKMLDCCENSEEARLLLLHDYKIDHYFTDALVDDMPYPRLEIAVADRHEEFVGHDYCQQILRQKWLQSDVTGDVIQWHSSTLYEKVFYCISCIFLLPVHVLMYIPLLLMGGYTKNEEGSKRLQNPDEKLEEETRLCCGLNFVKQSYLHLSFPINRFISQSISHLMFLVILVFNSENPEDDDKKLDMDWYDFCTPVMSFGFLVTELRELVKRYKGKNFSFWNFFNILLYLVLLGSKATIVIGFVVGCNKPEWGKTLLERMHNCTKESPHEHGSYSPVVIGYSFFGIGITMCFIRLMYFCQMNPTIGPIVISIKRIIKDIILVSVTHLIFLFSFGLGIFHVMQATNDEKCGADEKHSFNSIGESMKALFWNLFDPGKIEQLGCSAIPQRIPRYMGMFLFGMFLLFNVVILMNALIAIMNSTLNVVNMDKIKQWKFARTTIWLRHFDPNYVLPCPFNLIEFLVFSVRYFYKKCLCSSKQQKNLRKGWKTDSYMLLVEKLSQRYLVREEDSAANDITREDIENTKQDIIHAIRKIYG